MKIKTRNRRQRGGGILADIWYFFFPWLKPSLAASTASTAATDDTDNTAATDDNLPHISRWSNESGITNIPNNIPKYEDRWSDYSKVKLPARDSLFDDEWTLFRPSKGGKSRRRRHRRVRIPAKHKHRGGGWGWPTIRRNKPTLPPSPPPSKSPFSSFDKIPSVTINKNGTYTNYTPNDDYDDDDYVSDDEDKIYSNNGRKKGGKSRRRRHYTRSR
jgi:hypothetical protein